LPSKIEIPGNKLNNIDMRQPMTFLSKGTGRVNGNLTKCNVITIANIVSEFVRSTLGPKSMDKVFIDEIGEIYVTNDGITILEKMSNIENPVAKLLVEVALDHEKSVGDGIKTLIILIGELLKKGGNLREKGIQPSVIIKGYRKALDIAVDELQRIAKPAYIGNKALLREIVKTSFGSKNLGFGKDHIINIAIEAFYKIIEKRGGKICAEKDYIKTVKVLGGSLMESELINGVIINREIIHPMMPKSIKNARIALVNAALEIESPGYSVEISIEKPFQIKEFSQEENNILKSMVDNITQVGANVVFCQKRIDDIALYFLANAGILAIRYTGALDMKRLAKATGGNIVTNLETLTKKDLGKAGLVEERKIGEERLVFVLECEDPKAVTILFRAGLEKQLDEAERVFNDAIMNLIYLTKCAKYVPGGGAAEMAMANAIRNRALKYSGKEQLAVMAFAEALEIIPRILAENAGLNPIDILTQLKAKHEEGEYNYGVDVLSGGIQDMLKLGVIEPMETKKQLLKRAFEAAIMLLRIDEIIVVSREKRDRVTKGIIKFT